MKTRLPAALQRAALAALLALMATTALAPATHAGDADDAGDAGDADSIVGVWETAPTDKGYAHIEVTRRGDVYDGAIVWLNELLYPPATRWPARPRWTA